MNLTGASALVTGGSEGIGRAIAEALIAEGAKVLIAARREELLKHTASEIGADFLAADVSKEQDAKRLVEDTVRRFGRLDILVNNAGIGYFAPLTEMPLEAFEKVFSINVTGAMLVGKEAAKQFIRQNGGNLINIASTSALKGGKRGTAYSASKFALRGMTECWRDELRPHNVRVMLVNPSEVQTPFFEKVGFQQQASDKKLRGREIADAIVGALKMDDRGFIPEFSVWASNPW